MRGHVAVERVTVAIVTVANVVVLAVLVLPLALRPAVDSERVPVEEPARPLRARVGLDQRPELRAVPAVEQVRQLVQDDVVEHPGGHSLEPGRDPDPPVRRCAGPPAPALPGGPHDARGASATAEVPVGQLAGSRLEPLVGRAAALILDREAGDHHPDPLALLRAGEPGGDRHDHAAPLAEGRHGAHTPTAAADLDLLQGCGHGLVERAGRVVGHGSTLAPGADNGARGHGRGAPRGAASGAGPAGHYAERCTVTPGRPAEAHPAGRSINVRHASLLNGDTSWPTRPTRASSTA